MQNKMIMGSDGHLYAIAGAKTSIVGIADNSKAMAAFGTGAVEMGDMESSASHISSK
jgi:hypothetical protein